MDAEICSASMSRAGRLSSQKGKVGGVWSRVCGSRWGQNGAQPAIKLGWPAILLSTNVIACLIHARFSWAQHYEAVCVDVQPPDPLGAISVVMD